MIYGKSDSQPRLNVGRLSSGSGYSKQLYARQPKNDDILETIRAMHDEAEILHYMSKKVPDVSSAVSRFVRLSNQGHKMKFFAPNDSENEKELIDIENEWRIFASRVNSISNDGMDGLINQLHKYAIIKYGQMVEVEIDKSLTDIVDIYPIDMSTLEWKLEKRNGREVWVPYQHNFTENIDLSKGNIFCVPTDPDINDPRGNLMMGSAISAIDSQLGMLQDFGTVLHRVGYPRNDISLDKEGFIKSLPVNMRNDQKKVYEALTTEFNHWREMLSKLRPEEDYIHFNDVVINHNQAGTNSRGIDARAFNDIMDTQVLNGLGTMGTMSNRSTGKTETYSTVEFRIYVLAIESIQRGSKRLIEEIARLWLRVHGIQAKPVFTHNPVDWQSEIQKSEVALLKQELYANAQQLGWISPDEAAQKGIGRRTAYKALAPEQIKPNSNKNSFGIIYNKFSQMLEKMFAEKGDKPYNSD